MSEIFLDTETTGLSAKDGDRIIEIACVETENLISTGKVFYKLINPEKEISKEAFNVHGYTLERLNKEPKFSEIAKDLMNFISGKKLIIHNAPFDIGFLNNELKMASTKYPKIEDLCEVEDSLAIARDKYPGQRNSLDALAQRFDVKGYDRTFHGALLDANILSDVFIQLTGGQSKFEFITNGNTFKEDKINHNDFDENLLKGLKLINASKSEINSHESKLSDIEKKHQVETMWRKI